MDLQHTIKQNFHNILLQHPDFHNHKVISAHSKNRSLDTILHTSKFPDQITTPLLKHIQHYKNRKFIQNTSYLSQTRFHLCPLHQSFTSSHALCHKNCQRNTKSPNLFHNTFTILVNRSSTCRQPFQKHTVSHLIISSRACKSIPAGTWGRRKRAERIWITKLDPTIPNGLNDHC